MNEEQARELASIALNYFHNRAYESAIQTLEEIRNEDVKVQHNIAICKYKQSSCTEVQAILDRLSELRNIVESNSQQETENTTENNNATDIEDSDEHVIAYNQAVLYFQQKQYSNALLLLEKLFQNIEPVEEHLAINICFLLADLHLILKQKDKVALVIGYLEKNFPSFLRDSANVGNDITKPDSSDLSSPTMSGAEFRYYLHLCKARLHFLNGNIKSSKREMKLALGTNQNHNQEQNLMSTFLKANLEYLQQNYQKSIKLLNHLFYHQQQQTTNNNKKTAVLYYNNMGCIHYKLKKFHTAMFYFSKALQQQNEATGEKEVIDLPSYAHDHKIEILYNTGQQLLFAGNPELAFKCLQEAALFYYKQPKLWLRLAECCISYHLKKQREQQTNNLNWAIKKTNGAGKTKRIVLSPFSEHVHRAEPRAKEDSNLNNTDQADKSEEVLSSDIGQTLSVGTLSLEYGAKCVKNALLLLKETKPQPTSDNTANVTHNEYEDHQNLKQAILAASCYISLTDNNPVFALSSAKELLNLPNCSFNFRILGSIYAAEALCLLNNPIEAAEYLNPNKFGSIESADNRLPVSQYSSVQNTTLQQDKKREDDCSLNPWVALYLNLGVVSILKNDLVQAQQYVSKALSSAPSTRGVLLQTYIELRKGNTTGALHLLRSINQ